MPNVPAITTRGNGGRFVAAGSDPAPYPGPLKVGSTGPAVDALQQALHTWGAMRKKKNPHELLLRTTGATGDFGKATGLQCGHVQAVHGQQVTNTFGPAVHNDLAPYYSDYSRGLLVELHHQKLVAEFRQEMLAEARATAGYVLNETRKPHWRYTMSAPDRMSILDHDLDPAVTDYLSADCSSDTGSTIVVVARRLGLALPGWYEASPRDFYTGNMIGFGTPVAIGDIQPGDRVHYASNSHMGYFMGNVQGALAVSSFGSPGGPKPRLLTYRSITAIRRDYQ